MQFSENVVVDNGATGNLGSITAQAFQATGDFSNWVDPVAIADVIQFLVSDASCAINGAANPVFGKA